MFIVEKEGEFELLKKRVIKKTMHELNGMKKEAEDCLYFYLVEEHGLYLFK